MKIERRFASSDELRFEASDRCGDLFFHMVTGAVGACMLLTSDQAKELRAELDLAISQIEQREAA